jgi:radical SAM superfamily enzyme YgiQ (UPF0313 family)
MNRKLNIDLVLSADDGDPLRHTSPFSPLSLAILAASSPGHNYRIIDMLCENLEMDPLTDLAGISIRVSAERTAFRIADEYRRLGIKVILGGPQASANPFESLKHADAVAVGEGEKLWQVILDDFVNDRLRDFYVCSPEKFKGNGYRTFELDSLPGLSGLPLPRRDLFKKKYTFDMVYASRGCAINCDFCSVPGMFGTKYRFRPEEEVVNEIRTLKGYFYLIDDTVFGRPSTFDYYLSLYNKIARTGRPRYWIGQANLDASAHEKGREVIKKASDAGLIYLAIGMESIDKEVLRKSGSISKMGIGKDEDLLSRMKQNLQFIQRKGILVSGWFAIGYEDDDLETYRRTYEFCREMKIMPVFTPVHALMGTRLYERLKSKGALRDSSVNITNVNHPGISNGQALDALEEVAAKGYSLKEILRRTFHYGSILIKNRNLPGEIIHKTIFALITQLRLKQIVHQENRKLRDKIQSGTLKDA